MPQPCTCGQVLAPALAPGAPIQWKSDVNVRFKTPSEQDLQWILHWSSLRGETQTLSLILTVGHCFTIQEKQWPSTFVTFTLRLYNSYNHAHAKGQHMWPSLSREVSPWPYSKCSKTVEV